MVTSTRRATLWRRTMRRQHILVHHGGCRRILRFWHLKATVIRNGQHAMESMDCMSRAGVHIRQKVSSFPLPATAKDPASTFSASAATTGPRRRIQTDQTPRGAYIYIIRVVLASGTFASEGSLFALCEMPPNSAWSVFDSFQFILRWQSTNSVRNGNGGQQIYRAGSAADLGDCCLRGG